MKFSLMPSFQAYTDQSVYLSVLTATPAPEVKNFVETLLERVAGVEVLTSRTGLAMLPFTDSVKGVTFYLGETLLAEAHVRVGAQEGYAACLGRDLEQAIALAILDALLQSNEPAALAEQPAILHFVANAHHQQQQEESALLRKIEATRVELETF
jgi:alpha-D-ribose 1-methylphosphonate 5-triphosphate synthase subunit PhnG